MLDTESGINREFKRHAYQKADKSNHITIIHYIGDETVTVPFPHRNSTKSSHHHIRTCPSYLSKCAEECKIMKPGVLYKKEVSHQSTDDPKPLAEMPKNLKQLQNLRVKYLSHSRISKDELYNLHEIAYDTGDFVRTIVTVPSLVCVCGVKEVLGEANKVIMMNELGRLLSYDTTFMLGDFYVSILLFRHTVFVGNPCIPALFLIHEKKQFESHQLFFQEAVKAIPSLKSSSCCLITDKEQAIIKAAESVVPKLTKLQCWNHIFRDVRFWLRKYKAPAKEIAIYLDDISQMFHSTSEAEYMERLEEYSRTWDSAFHQYYIQEIHPDRAKIGRWALEALGKGLYNPYSGITNNQSEGFNRLIKDFQSWREAPLDSFVLALFQLQAYYRNEINRGLAGSYIHSKIYAYTSVRKYYIYTVHNLHH